MTTFFRPKKYAMKIDPTSKYAWINIPKNASSFIQKALYDNGWIDVPKENIDKIIESSIIKKLVVLRDPVDRWISGFSQCMFDHNLNILDIVDNKVFQSLIYLNPVFDDHTEYQHRFVGNAQNLVYIYMDKEKPNYFYRDLSIWIRTTGGVAGFDRWKDKINPTTNESRKLKINQALRTIFDNNTFRCLFDLDEEMLEKYDRFTN